MTKKYFWLKLKDDFFTDKKIKKLRKLAGGDTHTIIYLKMQLLSLKNDGYLVFDNLTSEFYEEIALELDEDEDNVKFTLMYLMSVGLVEEIYDKSLAMIETIGNIGKESDSAKRVRALRERQKNEQKSLQCNVTSVTCNTEKEKEIELELEKEKHNVVAKAPTAVSKNVMPVEMMEMIIDYLNNKFEKKKNYRLSDTYKKLFNALYKAGHRDIGEYQYVIDNKYSEWIGTDMQTYIRPATLFAKEKFEKYIDEEQFVAYSNNKHQQQLKPWEVEAYNEPTTSWNDNVNDRGSISKPVPHKQLGINF